VYVDTAVTDQQLVDLSATTHIAAVAAGSADGLEGVTSLNSLTVEEMWWSVQGYEALRLEWDHTTDSIIAILGVGEGYLDFRSYGGLADDGSGGTGDIFITSVTAGAANDTWDITIKFRKQWTT
jgi:hypothetical protein